MNATRFAATSPEPVSMPRSTYWTPPTVTVEGADRVCSCPIAEGRTCGVVRACPSSTTCTPAG
ncbi:MAG: hypothetical protein U0237_20885, partial [Thermoleophilia bacterium]